MNSKLKSSQDNDSELVFYITGKYQDVQQELKNKTHQYEIEKTERLKIVSELEEKIKSLDNSVGKMKIETKNKEILLLKDELIKNEK